MLIPSAAKGLNVVTGGAVVTKAVGLELELD